MRCSLPEDLGPSEQTFIRVVLQTSVQAVTHAGMEAAKKNTWLVQV